MAWLAVCIPLMVVGVAVATVPLAFGTHHQQKYGHHGTRPVPQEPSGSLLTPSAISSSNLTLCPSCSAIVADQSLHQNSVHSALTT